MKTNNPCLLPLVLAALGSLVACQVTAQTFTVLRSFTATDSNGIPSGGVVLSGNTLYGTSLPSSSQGMLAPVSTVFSVNTDSTGFTNLYEFTKLNGYPGGVGGADEIFTNSDGSGPNGLVLLGNTLYGAASGGGSGGSGTVFKISTDGTDFMNLHSFGTLGFFIDKTNRTLHYFNSDGGNPNGHLILSENTLYGTTAVLGSSDNGTVFKVNTDGTGFTNLYNFTATSYPYFTNSDGAIPQAGLILSGNTLYGTTSAGGSSGNGTVFALRTDGTAFTLLHNFTASVPVNDTNSPSYGFPTNSDGANPNAGLVLSGKTLYGEASSGGTSGNGTVFAINTDGTGFKILHSFTAGSTNAAGVYTNSDGANPLTDLILSGSNLYGAAGGGGTSGNGTVFAVNTDGTDFKTLHAFIGGVDVATSVWGLILSGNTLYGTASGGGSGVAGTVFSIFIQPQLTLIPSGPYVILTWPTNYAGFTLQSTTNLGSAAVWTTNSSPPVVIGGENVVINTISSRQQFYRLSQPLP